MRQVALCALVGLILAGCASSFTDKLDTLIGQPPDSVVVAIGAPSGIVEVGEMTVWTYPLKQIVTTTPVKNAYTGETMSYRTDAYGAKNVDLFFRGDSLQFWKKGQ